MRPFSKILLVTSILLWVHNGFAQNAPKIGLALSGGGAKGMAHIGVLRALEENNVKIDYISGTSMGAVVGAMYALGYSTDQIEYYLRRVDWDGLLNNTVPRNRLNILDRDTEHRYLLEFEVVDDKIKAPDAINQGQFMMKELSFLSWPAHGNSDFSTFKIPFLCMATDLESGESVALESGDLAEALRASVAFPSMFSPMEINGKLYVDGGVRNNLPILILKEEKGMDIVIASDVQGELYNKEELNNAIKILEQVSSFQNAIYNDEQIKEADIYIHPQVMEYDITDYEYTDTIIARGKRAADLKKEELAAIGSNSKINTSGQNLRLKDDIVVSNVEVVGNTKITERYIRSKLDLKKTGAYSAHQLEEGIDKLYGSNYFKYVAFNLLPQAGDSSYKLSLKVKERESDLSIRFGLHYDDDFKLGVLANITLRNAILSNSRFNVNLVLSENARGDLTYIYDRGFIPSIGIQFAFHRFGTRIYDDRVPLTSLTYQDFSVNAFLSSTIFDNYTIGGGIRFENVDYLENFNTLGIGDINNNYIHYYGFLDFDSFNRTFKPTKGFKLKSEIRAVARQFENLEFYEASSVAYLEFHQAISLGKRTGMRASLLGAGTIGADMDLPYNIYLGGLGENYNNFIFPFLGYRYMELIGRNATALRVDVFYEPFKNHFFTLKGNIGKMDPTFSELFNSSILLDGYGFSYGYNSPFGPLEFTLIASSNHSDILSYLSLGFWF